jgi:hypothetical protein
VLQSELIEAGEAVPARGERVRVEVLVGRAVGEEVGVGLARDAASASWTSGSARKAAARSLSSR